MCGFAGIFSPFGITDSLRHDFFPIVHSTLSHRGPDSNGIFQDHHILLSHHRLAIRDLTPSGAQPMRDLRSGVVLVFNGEIYNHESLRSQLSPSLVSPWRGTSDTETILALYITGGIQALYKLEGIFSLAIYDPRSNSVFLLRDRLGVKPLFYYTDGSTLFFASEIKALLASTSSKFTLDNQALSEYLVFGSTYLSTTFYSEIKTLQPGHQLLFDSDAHIQINCWWSLETELINTQSHSNPSSELLHLLHQTVQRQLISDAPIGLLLSGGVDSSTLAYIASRYTSNITLYTASFDQSVQSSDVRTASSTANALGLPHKILPINFNDLVSSIETLALAHDEPFADAANVPLMLMCRALPNSTKVVLQGDGGDEIFGGYNRYSLLAAFPRIHSLLHLIPSSLLPYRLKRLVYSLRQEPDLRMASLLTVQDTTNLPYSLFNTEFSQHLQSTTDPFAAYSQCASRFSSLSPLQQMLCTDPVLELPSVFLPKVDRASMSVGIEARVPLLDDLLLRFSLTLPSKLKERYLHSKKLLKSSLKSTLPPHILHKTKAGFGVPYHAWLSGPLREHSLLHVLEPSFLRYFNLNPIALESLFYNLNPSSSHMFLKWKIYQLSLWFKFYSSNV